MPDSMDPIVALYRRFGGDPDRLYGQSPAEKERALKLRGPDLVERYLDRRYGSVTEMHGLQPLNPFLHSDIITMAQEAATALNVPTPRLYQMLDARTFGVLVAGCRYPNIVVLDTTILKQLTPDECQAVLYHELHHARQPWSLMQFSQEIGESLLGRSWIHRPGMHLLERCIAYRQSMEHEASGVAAHFTSPEVMQRAFLKGLALALMQNDPDLQIDLSQPAFEIAASLDAHQGTKPDTRLATGGTISQHVAFLENLMHEDHAARGFPNPSRC